MRETSDGWRPPDPSKDTNSPKNPPQSLMRREVRRFAVMSYLGPVIVLFVVIGIALIYWANRSPIPSPEPNDLDTAGTAGFQPQGGSGARPKFDSTADELKYRGSRLDAPVSQAGRSALTEIDKVAATKTAGQRVSLPLAEVSAVEGGNFWVHDGNNRVAVIAPDGVQVRQGDHVSVDGITELDPSGSVRVRASRVEVP
jgi:hypothetical protein